jgi:large subunit ribosomal protein L21
MMADTYAIIETGGKQYRAEKGVTLLVERLSDDEGAKVSLRPVMYRGDKDVVAAAADLEKVKVEAVVAEHLRGEKVRIFKHKAKKGYRRRAGHRQELTKLEVTDVKLLSRKPAAKAETKPAAAKAEKEPAAANAEAKPAAAKGAAKPKAPAKKPAAKKSAAKKPAAKKPAAKKTSSTRTKKES